ncbi:MAG: Wzz/FepE/Etk N-terminal domain-containing protein [Bacteroidetes bacterium]|jgi:uncharacterized protein involved in exopolysaccharide biosynthesis|nr:Wzz/FepE/Etk N-terminal domain-containing protein [Bacteroidota bacterium]
MTASDVHTVRFSDLAVVVARRLRLIGWVTLTGLVVGLVLAFTVTRHYKSVTRILPPKESPTLAGLAGLSSLVKNLPGGLTKFGGATDAYDYVALLKSRTISEEVVHRFNLKAVYEMSDSSMERTIKALWMNVEVDWTEENTLEIRVWDEDAQRAADMANAFVQLLNQRSYELQTQEGRNNRVFIEQRVAQNREDLFRAEQELKKYQEQEGLIILPEGSSGGVGAIAELYAMKVQKEIELEVLSKSVERASPLYQRALLEYRSIDEKIARIPDVGMNSLRRYREVLIQQKIMELIVPIYEQAKINEYKDVPVAYVLDAAKPGERPDRPKRLFVLGISVFLSLVIAFGTVAFMEYRAWMISERPELSQIWKELFRGRDRG